MAAGARGGAVAGVEPDWEPGYPRPFPTRLAFAGRELIRLEEFIAPGSAVLASLLVRALLARGCTTAEAMWAVYGRIKSGHYQAAPLGRSSSSYLVTEQNVPSGLEVADGALHIDGGAGDWGYLVVTVPTSGSNADHVKIAPACPQPPENMIVAVQAAIPTVLAGMRNEVFANRLPEAGHRVVQASSLQRELVAAGYHIAAAHWAILQSIDDGSLRAEFIVDLAQPEDCEAPISKKAERFFGERGRTWQPTPAVPTTPRHNSPGPVPFESILVYSTDRLWAEWGDPAAGHAHAVMPVAGADEHHGRARGDLTGTQVGERGTMTPEDFCPFTVPGPQWHFTGKPIFGEGESKSWDLATLKERLLTIGSWYIACNHEMQVGPWYDQRRAFGTRDANLSDFLRTFQAVDDSDRFRTVVRLRFKADLSAKVVDDVVTEMVLEAKGTLTISVAEKLSLGAAADLLKSEKPQRESRPRPRSGRKASDPTWANIANEFALHHRGRNGRTDYKALLKAMRNHMGAREAEDAGLSLSALKDHFERVRKRQEYAEKSPRS